MEKRGQIAVFLILGIAIIILTGFVFYTASNIAKQDVDSAIKETAKTPTEITPIKIYAESCLKDVSERGLWLIGEHGGYIDPDGNATYGEDGIDPSLYTTYNKKKVPYYLNDFSYTSSFLGLNDIEKKLAKYIIVEFEKCFDSRAFEDEGFYITGPDINYTDIEFDFNIVEVDSKVSINRDSVAVNIKYPLDIKKKDFNSRIEDFRAELPVRLGRIYNTSFNNNAPEGLLKNITDKWSNGEEYKIEDFNCDSHDPLKQINIYSRNNDDNIGDTKIIRVVDYFPFYNKYLKAYIFQFAIKREDSIEIEDGVCSGDED